MLSFEALLLYGVLALYLFDSGMLLYANELVFVRDEFAAWRLNCRRIDWLLLGRRPCAPNPLRPDIAVFRVYWLDADQRPREVAGTLDTLLAALEPLRYLLIALLVLFFVWLPIILILYGSGPQLLGLFAIVYLNIVAILVFIFRNRRLLQVSNGTYLALSFESLACPPFALNLLRKITLRLVDADPIRLAEKRFDQDDFRDLIELVCRRIDEQLDLMNSDDPRYSTLQAYKSDILGLKRLRPDAAP